MGVDDVRQSLEATDERPAVEPDEARAEYGLERPPHLGLHAWTAARDPERPHREERRLARGEIAEPADGEQDEADCEGATRRQEAQGTAARKPGGGRGGGRRSLAGCSPLLAPSRHGTE